MSELRESRRRDDYRFYLDLSTPTETQMKNVVRGDDRTRNPKLGMLLFGLFLVALAFVGGLVWYSWN